MGRRLAGLTVFLLTTLAVHSAAVPAHPGLALALSDSAGIALFGNYMTIATSYVSPHLELRVGAMEAGLGWRSFTSVFYPETGGWRADAELALAPALGCYNPEIGIGFLYTVLVPQGSYPDADAMTLYLLMVPLRFAFDVSARAQLLVSGLELRYGPLVPVNTTLIGNQGAFHLDVTLLRLGFRVVFDHDG